MTAANERHALQEARVRLVEPEAGPVERGQHVEQRKDVGLRIAAQDFSEHTLGSTNRIKPIVDDGDAQRIFLSLFVPIGAASTTTAPLFEFGEAGQSETDSVLN
jgi:hypothetical protein